MSGGPRHPLDRMAAAAIGLPSGAPLTRATLAEHQRRQFGATLAFVRRCSPFYRERLATYREGPAGLPLTDASQLRQDPLRFLCVSQGEVARAVTLWSSGTSGAPKRLFFSREELKSTAAFFGGGMATIVPPEGRVHVLLPGAAPDSVGALLHAALARRAIWSRVLGQVQDPLAALAQIAADAADCLVGIPIQVLALARHPESARLAGRIRSVLLSTDYVPQAVVKALAETWGCSVFQHYGMTEMGYGGGLECACHAGYHLREADLLFEIVDPDSGLPLPDGRKGEVVFSTLTRRAMPLLRYRTGDLAAMHAEPCPCGSVLRRLTRVGGRLEDRIVWGADEILEPADLEEALLALPGLTNFTAALEREEGGDRLRVTAYCGGLPPGDLAAAAAQAIAAVPAVRAAMEAGVLKLAPVRIEAGYGPLTGKRTIGQHVKG